MKKALIIFLSISLSCSWCLAKAKSSNNPYYQLGYQTEAIQELLIRYKTEVINQRLQKPLQEPGNLEQKYLGLLQGFDASLVVKYFVEPAHQVDEEDFQQYAINKQAEYQNNLISSARGELDKTLQSELSAWGNGNETREVFQNNVVRSFEDILKSSMTDSRFFASIPEAMLDVVLLRAELQPDLTHKEDVLKILDMVKTPDGKNFINLPGIMDKFTKAHEEMVADSVHQDLEKQQLRVLQLQEDTTARINEMSQDNLNKRLKTWTYYMTPYEGRPIDYAEIDRLWKFYKTREIVRKKGR